MKFTSTEEYGLRCLLRVARGGDKPLGITEIAQAEGLSSAYAGKLLYLLRKGSLVSSTRGPKGGYVLGKPAAQISMGQALSALGSIASTETELCQEYPGEKKECVHFNGACSIRSVWHLIYQDIWKTLDRVTIADLMIEKTQISWETSAPATAPSFREAETSEVNNVPA